MRKLLIPIFALIACGDNTRPVDAAVIEEPIPLDAPSIDALSTDAISVDAVIVDGGAFVVSSTAIADGMILRTHSCFGANISPPLAWSGAPQGTRGYAVVFSDITNGLIHSAIWDVPSTFAGLPENIAKIAEPTTPAGSKQPLAYDLFTRGYLGPCPGGGPSHTYQFTVYAVDEYPLSGVTLQTSRQLVRAKVEERALAKAHLEALF